jgi:splicing factor 3B subunit 1
LFHAARKVREVYWKIYNTLYIAKQDAIVMCYPHLEDVGENTYRRTELELFI